MLCQTLLFAFALIPQLVQDDDVKIVVNDRPVTVIVNGGPANIIVGKAPPDSIGQIQTVLSTTKTQSQVNEPEIVNNPINENQPETISEIQSETISEYQPNKISENQQELTDYQPAKNVKPYVWHNNLLAIRTNLLYDLLYMPQFGWAFSPNVQLEYYPRRSRYTFNIGVTWTTYRYYDRQKFWQIRNADIELRRYFRRKGNHMGPYLGLEAQGSVYGISFDSEKGWRGEGYGGALTTGWVWPLCKSKRWRIEASVGIGYFRTHYDTFVCGNPLSGESDGHFYFGHYDDASTFNKRAHLFQWIGPTQVGICITRDLLFYKKKGDGL